MDENLLYYGDNLDVLRRYIKDESVDLIYLVSYSQNRTAHGLGACIERAALSLYLVPQPSPCQG
jgi:hypothetical protein